MACGLPFLQYCSVASLRPQNQLRGDVRGRRRAPADGAVATLTIIAIASLALNLHAMLAFFVARRKN